MLMLEGSSEIEIKFFIFTDGKKKKKPKAHGVSKICRAPYYMIFSSQKNRPISNFYLQCLRQGKEQLAPDPILARST